MIAADGGMRALGDHAADWAWSNQSRVCHMALGHLDSSHRPLAYAQALRERAAVFVRRPVRRGTLLEEKRHADEFAIAPDALRPLLEHRPRLPAALTAHDHPMDAVKVILHWNLLEQRLHRKE